MVSSQVSTLYFNGTIITVNQSRDVILDGAILVLGDRIQAIGKTNELINSAALPLNTKKIDLEGNVVIPGLINAHAHLIQSLMRGLGEDMALHRWACDMVWPLEASLQGDDGYVAAKLAIAEMLKTGTTCFLEPMLPSHANFGRIVNAVEESGIRACLGTLVKSQKPNARAGETFVDARDNNASDMSVQAALARHQEYHGKFGRLNVWMAAETPRGVDETIFAEVGDACEKHNMRLTVHVAEATRDKELIRECYGASPVQFCQTNKLTSDRTVLAHMCHLDLDVDLDILKSTGTSVVHNPTSNCKLADGIAAIPQMLAKGINVALGTDGAPCSNTYDLFRDMHLAGIIHKGVTRNASVLPSEQVLEMATVNGAKALGLEKDIGSLEVRKKADFVVIDATGLGSAPYDPQQLGRGGVHAVTTIVHSCGGGDVRMVVVDGSVVVENGVLLTIDEEDIKQKARKASIQLRERAGTHVQPLKLGWNYI